MVQKYIFFDMAADGFFLAAAKKMCLSSLFAGKVPPCSYNENPNVLCIFKIYVHLRLNLKPNLL